jgi:integrase/recombinase XerD
MKTYNANLTLPTLTVRTHKRTDSQGLQAVQVRIHWDYRTKDFGLKFKCKPEDLDPKYWIIKDDDFHTQYIQRWRRDLTEAANEAVLQGVYPDPSEVYRLALAKRGLYRYPTVVEMLAEECEYAQQRYENGQASRHLVMQYNAYAKNIKAYLADCRRLDLSFASLTPDDARGFFEYATQRLKYCHKYTVKNFGMLTRLTGRAYAQGWTKTNPFVGVRFRKTQNNPVVYLTEAEITAIEKHVFTEESLQKVRDCFLFQCFTGLAYVDASELTEQDLVTVGGVLCIRKQRSKSGVLSFVPLLPQALHIIEKHRNRLFLGRLLPFVSNAKMNVHLKTIGQRVGITRIKLTTHLARKSAATMLLNRGVTMTTVSKVLGHANSKITGEIYAVVHEKTVVKEFTDIFSNQKAV